MSARGPQNRAKILTRESDASATPMSDVLKQYRLLNTNEGRIYHLV